MSALSIRKLPKEIERALLREARARGKTKTEIVLQALENQFHLGGPGKKSPKIREFFGRMTRAELESFKKATEDFSKIEEDLWR